MAMRLKYCAFFSLLFMEHVPKRRMACVSTEVFTTQVITLFAFYPAKRDFTSLFPLSREATPSTLGTFDFLYLFVYIKAGEVNPPSIRGIAEQL